MELAVIMINSYWHSLKHYTHGKELSYFRLNEKNIFLPLVVNIPRATSWKFRIAFSTLLLWLIPKHFQVLCCWNWSFNCWFKTEALVIWITDWPVGVSETSEYSMEKIYQISMKRGWAIRWFILITERFKM